MKATVTAFAVVVAATLGAAVTQATPANQVPQTAPPTQAAQDQKKVPPDVTLTGCIIQGSSPTVFILDNAKLDPASTSEKGVRYLLASVSEDVDIRSNLNKQVRIVGEVDAKVSADPVTVPPVPPVTPPTDPEKSLSKLKAKSVTMVSDTCATVR